MPEIKHLFNAGRMNKDLDERLIPNGEYRDALNVQLSSTDTSDIGAIQNILGNLYINSGLSFSNPFFKGYAVDFSTKKIYWLLKEDFASYLFSYNGTSVVTLIKDVGNLVFKFDSENLITGINFFEGFLAFTDNLNEPKIIDLRLFEAGTDKISAETGANGRTQINGVDLQEKDITVIKEKPLNAPKIGFTLTTEFGTDPVIFEDKFVRFAYRWKFKNGQYSPLSPFSITAFVPKEEIEYDLEEGFNVQMLNNVTSIDLVDIETKEDVEYIDILYKESNNNNVYVYKTIPATDLSTPDSVVTITKESVYSVIPSDQILRHYDNVPKKALAQDVIGNRIVYGNYTDGINLGGYEPNFSIGLQNRIAVDLDNISLSIGQRYRSIKAGRNYQIGILFEDKYGRQTPVLSNDTGSIYRDFTGIGFGKELTVSTSAAPISSDITRFKYYIKSTEQEYYNIVVDEAYNDTDEPETFLWLVIPSYEINKVEEQDFIILKKGANSDVALNNPALKYKVLDIQNSKPDNISSSKAFNDKFFVKLKKDVYLTEELFAQQGLGGASGIISDGDEEWIVGTGGMSSGALSLYYFDYYGTRTTYYYQDGKIYEGESQVSESSTATNAPTGTTVNPACGDGMDDWFVVGSSVFGFVDSLGNTIEAIYVRKIEGGVTVPAAQDFLICYENSNTNVPDPSPAIFETIPKNDILDIYYETEESYPISEIAETKRLQWYNCLDLTNGVESNRIRDDFNEVTIDKQVRVSTTISEQFKERENTSGLIWSGLFNSRNSVNRLNQFSTGEAITKDLNPEYGTIQKLHSRDTDLIALCEDKILRILANKDALYNADGSTNITASNNVLGQAMPYNGEFGISTNPESFTSFGYQAYFTDKSRGAVLRLSKDGLTLISDKGMATYFRDKLKNHNNKIIGSYDIHTRQYVLSFKSDESVAFSESVDGWTSRLNFVPDGGLFLNGQYFTFKNGQIWLHHSDGINNFYGVQYSSSVKFIFNNEPSVVKNFKTIAFEGTQGNTTSVNGWKATSITTDLQQGKVIYFKGKEGKWFNNIDGISKDKNTLDSKEFSIQGIGSLSSTSVPQPVPTPTPTPQPQPVPTPTPQPTAPVPAPIVVPVVEPVPVPVPVPAPTVIVDPVPIPVPIVPVPQAPVPVAPDEFYELYKCSDGSTWRSQETILELPGLSYPQRVVGSGPTYYYILGPTFSTANNAGSVDEVVGELNCPVVPIPVPVVAYNYYFAEPCDGGTTVYMRSITAFSPGESFKFAGDSTCYVVGASGAPINSNDWSEAFPDCEACQPPVPAPIVPVPIVPVPAPIVPDEYWPLFNCTTQTSGWRSQQTTSELLGLFSPQRVVGSGPTYYYVEEGTTTSGSNVGIISVVPGELSCPVVPIPVPTISYTYYFAEPCDGGSTIYMRSSTTWTPGEAFKLSGDDTCYVVGASGAPINSNDPVEGFPDCEACPAPVPVPQPVPQPVAPVVYEYKIHASQDSGESGSIDACGQLTQISVWTDYSTLNESIQVGAVWYEDQNLNPYGGDFLWYGVSQTNQLDSIYSVLLSDTGTVQQVYDCSTPTPVPQPVPVPAPAASTSYETTDCATGNPGNRVPYEESYTPGATSVKLSSGCFLIGFPSNLSAEEIPSNVYNDCTACNNSQSVPQPVPQPVAPVPQPVPAPVPVPVPLGCYTYSVENNDQSFSATIEYNDCDGNGQSFILNADTATPDFCAEAGSVRRQSGTFNIVIYEEATTCTVVPPSPTPIPTPTPQPTAPVPQPVPQPTAPVPQPVPQPVAPVAPQPVPQPVPVAPQPVPQPVAPVPQPQPVPQPVPAPVSDNVFIVEASGVVGDYLQLVQGYSIGDFVTSSEHGTTCLEIMNTAYVINPSAFGTVEGPCIVPTPNPTPVPQPVANTSGYSCINNVCEFVGSGAQYATLRDCNLDCGEMP